MLIALVYIVAGIVMVMNPGASAVWFAMFIAAFLFISGIFRIVIGFQIRDQVRGWSVFGGIASIELAFMIFAQWPLSGLWVIGLFIAIEMIMQGTSMISIAMAAKASKDARAGAWDSTQSIFEMIGSGPRRDQSARGRASYNDATSRCKSCRSAALAAILSDCTLTTP